MKVSVVIPVYNERNFIDEILRRVQESGVADEVVADFEYDPKEYTGLIEPILDGRADVVYGYRFLGGPQRVHLFWHYVGNKCSAPR